MSVLEGLLLSDGCLQRARRSKSWHYQQTCREPTLLAWSKEHIPGGSAIVRGPYGAHSYYRIRTNVDAAYGVARERWYVGETKVIPDDFVATPTSMLAAYLGDGSLSYDRAIRLATCAFPIDQVQSLADQLIRLGFGAGVRKLRPPYHEIVLVVSSSADFLQWIGPSPLVAYNYKWSVRPYALRVCGKCGIARELFTRGCAACRSRRWTKKHAGTVPFVG